jgi:hypothetical protein
VPLLLRQATKLKEVTEFVGVSVVASLLSLNPVDNEFVIHGSLNWR